MGIALWQSLSDRAENMARRAFEDVRTLDDWKSVRAQRHQQFMRSLGLDPLPERCDLRVTDHGAFEGKGFRARKVALEILPDCWTSACVYQPDPMPAGRAPGVLYVCGHATIGTYHYQYHPILWARRGYVCLIVDTIEQDDNPGEHHGSLIGREDAWLSMGYTPAGAEVWNGMRALDALVADPRVDPERIAVTGVSGGGACSFHLAAVDDRVKAVSTLCGISSPVDAITNRRLAGHCDCMYPLNLHARDISEYAALIAPRAALFCFADHDTLFYPEETRALVDRTRHVYGLYGRDDRCVLVTCPGPHGDHPEFDEATSRWFDRHVAGEERPLLARGERDVPETVTSVFNGEPPAPNRLELFPQLICPRGTVPLPEQPEDWPGIRGKALDALRTQVLHALREHRGEPPLELDGDWQWTAGPEPIAFRAHRGRIDALDVWLHMVTPPACRRKLILSIACEGETSMHALNRAACAIDAGSVAYAGFQPRMAGANSTAQETGDWPPGARLPSVRNLLLRAMALAGTTPVMMTIEDIGVAVDYLSERPEAKGREIYLCGKGGGGVAALYYALLDERIAGVVAEDAPSTHLDGAPLLGILRRFDIPQAVGLMAPRKVALVTPGHSFWTWPSRVYERLGCSERFIMATDMRQAMDKMLV